MQWALINSALHLVDICLLENISEFLKLMTCDFTWLNWSACRTSFGFLPKQDEDKEPLNITNAGFFYLPGLRLFHLAAGLLSRWRLPPGESSNLSLKKWLVEILRGGLPPGEAGGGRETNIQNKVTLTTFFLTYFCSFSNRSFLDRLTVRQAVGADYIPKMSFLLL